MIYRKNTKELLAESLLELSNSKSVEKITIKEITENCQMTSPTFYNHFRDKYDLIAWIYGCQADKIIADYAEGNSTWEQTIYEVLRFLKGDFDFYHNALKNTSGQNSFAKAVRGYSITTMVTLLENKKGKELSGEEKFQLNFYVAGWVDAVTTWMTEPSSFEETFLAAMLARVVPPLLQRYIQ